MELLHFKLIVEENGTTQDVEIPTPIPSNSNQLETTTLKQVINNETLISMVYARRNLWDYRIPLQQRTNFKIKAMWQEIADEFEGTYLLI